MLGVEQKFDLLLENYAEYERQLLDIGLQEALRGERRWSGSQGDIATVTRRLSNLLSAARLYVDQVTHDLRTAFGRKHPVAGTVKSATASQYEERLGYRVMEALRNTMQHRSLVVHELSYSHDHHDGGERIHVVPRALVTSLRASGVKKKVVRELESLGDDRASLTPLVRDYVEGLAMVHVAIRTATAPQLKAWDETLTGAQARAAERWGGGPDAAFLAVELSPHKRALDSFHVFTKLIEYRRYLERRNGKLKLLANRFVSGAPKD